MKLTSTIRQAFIAAVMNDVPQIDHDAQARALVEQRTKELFAEAFPGADFEELKPWAARKWVSTPGLLSNVAVYWPGREHDQDDVKKNYPELWAELEKLSTAKYEQGDRLVALEERLRSVVNACSTRKALAEALPEFEKYLPPEPVKGANVPAVANVVADFMKAGWPK